MKISRYTGRADDPDFPEAAHLANCEFCGALIDLRDLARLMADMHGREVKEVGPEPLT